MRTSCPAIVTDGQVMPLTMIGSDQVVPPSVERITATLNEALRVPLAALGGDQVEAVDQHPLAGPVVGTTIWLPMVWFFCPGSKMTRPGLQVTPLSVVFENSAGPRKAGE